MKKPFLRIAIGFVWVILCFPLPLLFASMLQKGINFGGLKFAPNLLCLEFGAYILIASGLRGLRDLSENSRRAFPFAVTSSMIAVINTVDFTDTDIIKTIVTAAFALSNFLLVLFVSKGAIEMAENSKNNEFAKRLRLYLKILCVAAPVVIAGNLLLLIPAMQEGGLAVIGGFIGTVAVIALAVQGALFALTMLALFEANRILREYIEKNG